MLSSNEFIKESLDLNLFFQRIAKEHSLFMEASFTPKDSRLAKTADNFKNGFEKLLSETIDIINRHFNNMINEGQYVTPYTLPTEKKTSFYTGIPIDFEITEREQSALRNDSSQNNLENQVRSLNNKSIELSNGLIKFKTDVLNGMLECRLYTTNYPLLIQHIINEIKYYVELLNRLQRKEDIFTRENLKRDELFWNNKMMEHAEFIRGLLDPSEKDLYNEADRFAHIFERLSDVLLNTDQNNLNMITNEIQRAVTQIAQFKASGTRGLLDCKIKSIILPLLGDHVLREANFYNVILKRYNR